MPLQLERAENVAGALARGLRDARRGSAVHLDDLLQISRFALAVDGTEAGGVADPDPSMSGIDLLVLHDPEILELLVERGTAAEEVVNVLPAKGAVDRREVDLCGAAPQLAHQRTLLLMADAGDGP